MGTKDDLVARVFQFMEGKVLIGIDPGENTGIVEVNNGLISCRGTKSVTQVWEYINLLRSDHILVIENYLEYHSSRGGNIFKAPIPAHIIGAIQYQSFWLKFDLILQHANVGKQSCPDDMLKLFFDTKGFTRHEKDALRHVVAYALSQIGSKITKGVQ